MKKGTNKREVMRKENMKIIIERRGKREKGWEKEKERTGKKEEERRNKM